MRDTRLGSSHRLLQWCGAGSVAFSLASGVPIASADTDTQTAVETASPEVAKKEVVSVPQNVQKALQKEGYARVIIGLDANFQPEGYLTPDEIQAQRAQIARVQELFLNGLKKTFLPISEDKFSTVPYVVIYLNEAVLQYVVQNPLVTSIESDGLGSSGVGGTH